MFISPKFLFEGPEVLGEPRGVAVSDRDGLLFIADAGKHLIRAVDLATMEVITVCGTPDTSEFRCAAAPPSLHR